MKTRYGFAAAVAMAFCCQAFAQYGTPQSLKAEADGGPLTFPAEAESAATLSGSRLSSSLYKPDGNGPFPALLLLHNCGGPASHLERWARTALAEGYVVLIPNSMRGQPNNCMAPPRISLGRRVADALDSIAFLAALPYVDKSRIVAAGFSQGAHVAEWLASPGVATTLGAAGTPRVAAVVAAYGFCALAPNRVRPQGAVVTQDDTDRPLLMLLGEQDQETPPKSCLERLPMLKEKGAPVSWHLYPGATHGWDQFENSGRTKTIWNGERITNYFDETTTADSIKRSFEFFRQTAGTR